MGELAAGLVLADDRPGQPRIIPVPGEVILRDSTRTSPPRA
jgi:hypothetical protein